jgi:hypothetical protein
MRGYFVMRGVQFISDLKQGRRTYRFQQEASAGRIAGRTGNPRRTRRDHRLLVARIFRLSAELP